MERQNLFEKYDSNNDDQPSSTNQLEPVVQGPSLTSMDPGFLRLIEMIRNQMEEHDMIEPDEDLPENIMDEILNDHLVNSSSFNNVQRSKDSIKN